MDMSCELHGKNVILAAENWRISEGPKSSPVDLARFKHNIYDIHGVYFKQAKQLSTSASANVQSQAVNTKFMPLV